MVVIRLGADLGLFRHLASHDDSLTVDQMAGLTTASPQLLGTLFVIQYLYFVCWLTRQIERILRCLGSNSLIKEVGVNEYQANNTTRLLANPNVEAGVYHMLVSL